MCHALIIEDGPLVAMMIEEALELAGATSFDTAASEAEALDLAARHPPAVITSDVRLIECCGPRAVEQIRERHGAIPVIFITGSPHECEPCDAVRCLRSRLRSVRFRMRSSALSGKSVQRKNKELRLAATAHINSAL